MTIHIIGRVSELNADKAKYRLQGVSGTVPYGTSGNVDWKFPEERWIDGGELILENHSSDDTFKFQIVDVDNVLGYGAGLVLDEYGTDLPVSTDQQSQGKESCSYTALIPANVYLRIVYTSTGNTDVKVRLRLSTHIPRA